MVVAWEQTRRVHVQVCEHHAFATWCRLVLIVLLLQMLIL
jgi:hypothetical protein